MQERSQDFSEGGSQEPRQRRRGRVVCDALAHTSRTQILASFPGPHCEQCARRGRRGDLGTKLRQCTESSQLTFDRIMLASRMPNAEHHSYSLLQARRTRHTANRSLGAPSSSTSLAEPRLLAPRRPRIALKISVPRLCLCTIQTIIAHELYHGKTVWFKRLYTSVQPGSTPFVREEGGGGVSRQRRNSLYTPLLYIGGRSNE